MRIEACLLLTTCASVWSRRGPHHPAHASVDRRHHRPNADTLTGDSQVLRDTRHIEEDSAVLTAEALSLMTPEELEFHYFLAHDFDKNSMLDGLELLKAVYHTIEHVHEHEGTDLDLSTDSSIEPEANNLETYIALVDRTLQEDDQDNDGFVSYAEYRAARDKSEGRNANRTPHVLASTT